MKDENQDLAGDYDIHFSPKRKKMKNIIAKVHEEKHETCDGCQMFSESGCMLHDSCPECIEHHLWTPEAEEMKELEDKIAAIIRKHEFWTYGAEEAAKEIATLLRSELIAYDKWMSVHNWGTHDIRTVEKAVDEYLKQKK
jgi:hypothetical protein